MDPQDGGRQSGVSCGTFLGRQVAIELAEQGIAVFLGPVGQVRDEILDLLPGRFAQSLGAAEVRGVGLHQSRIELMLSNNLTETISHFRTAVTSIGMLRR